MFLPQIINSLVFLILEFQSAAGEINSSICPENFCQWKYPNDTTPQPPNAIPDFNAQRCFCDEDCWKFDDCCDDAQFSHQPTQPRTSIKMFCHQFPGYSQSVYVVKTCPSSWKDNITRQLCERNVDEKQYQPILDIPFYNLNSVYLYLNIYCAKCNGDHLNVTALKLKVTCNPSQNCTEDFRRSSSYIAGMLEWISPNGVVLTANIVDPKIYLFRICRQIEDKCASNWTDTRMLQLCTNSSSLYVLSDYTVYKNMYCAQCHHKDVTTLQCPQPQSFKFGPKMNKVNPEFQFNWILDFSLSPSQKCLDFDEIYDEFMDKCMSLSCSENYVLVDGECVLEAQLQNNTANYSMYSCIGVQLSTNELLIFPNKSVYWNRTQTLYNENETELIDNTTYRLCIDDDELGSKIIGVRHFSADHSILSIICTSISLLCLAAHITIQYLTEQHRKLPGKCLLNLSISLFIGHLLLIVGVNHTELENICFVIAILIHFFFLTVFFWMNIMAFDICRTFTRSFQISSWDSKTYYCYSAYAWLIPSIIVSIAVVIDRVHPTSNIRPYYGHDVCWISDRFALFIFFALPLAILLVENLIFFLITAYKINETVKMNDNLKKSTECKRFHVYVKLAFVVGVPWVVGFIAALTDFEPLWYAFTTLNASQGIFIFVIFTLKRSIFNKLRKKVTGKSSPDTSISKRTEITSINRN